MIRPQSLLVQLKLNRNLVYYPNGNYNGDASTIEMTIVVNAVNLRYTSQSEIILNTQKILTFLPSGRASAAFRASSSVSY